MQYISVALAFMLAVVGKSAQQTAQPGEIQHMVKNMDELQQFGKENMDATMKSFGSLSKSWQAIASEMTDYSKKVFEQGTAATEKLLGAKSFEKAVEVQTEFAKSAYEGFVAEATKLGELYSDLARDLYRPYEGQFGKSELREVIRPAGGSPAPSPGSVFGAPYGALFYLATRRLESAVPIWLKVVMIAFAEVSRKNLSVLLAQFCRSVDVGSPPVLTCTV